MTTCVAAFITAGQLRRHGFDERTRLISIRHKHLDDGVDGNVIMAWVPAIVIRYHGDSCVTHLGFTSELRFWHVRHADHVTPPRPVKLGFRQRRELRPLHCEVSAPHLMRYA